MDQIVNVGDLKFQFLTEFKNSAVDHQIIYVPSSL